MYKTRIKEKYQSVFTGWWAEDGTGEYDVLMTIGDASLIYSEETGLILDIYNNKLEVFKPVQEHKIYVEAKNLDYADRFDLHAEYEIIGYIEAKPDSNSGSSPILLKISNGTRRVRTMLPSRLRVTRIE